MDAPNPVPPIHPEGGTDVVGQAARRGSARSAVRGTLAVNYAVLLLGGVSGILAARLLGADGRGELAAIQVWPTTLGVLASLGLPEALVFFAARDYASSGRLVVTATALGIVASVAAAALGWVLLPWLLHAQDAAVVAAGRVYLIVTVFFAAGISFHVLRAAERLRSWNLLRALPAASWLGILTWASATSTDDPVLLSRCVIVSSVVLCVPFLVWTVRRVVPPLRFDRTLVAPLVRYGLPGAAAGLPQFLNLRLDQLVMVAFVGSENLGLYVVAVSWSMLALPLSQAVGVVLLPRLAGEPAEVQAERLVRGVRLTLAATALLVVPLLVATPAVLPVLFGQAFDRAVVAAELLLVASLALAAASVLQEGARGLGRPGLVLRSEVVGLLATLAALPVSLPLFGIAGAAVASLLGYATTALTVAMARPVRDLTGPLGRLLPRRRDVADLLGPALRRLRPQATP